MNFVLAPDKFKGSLTGLEFCDAVAEGIRSVMPNADIVKLPLADGGDGTIEVVNYYLKGEIVNIEVNNPFFQPIRASYLYSESTKTAFIEMAEASGVKLLSTSELDCKNATTLGTGEMIVDAIDKGALTIILGIGGSATNDCGIGMATALGYKFLDKNGQIVKPIGANLSRIDKIDNSRVHQRINEVVFKVACDVTNPLYGKNGAAHVYAAQKGATQEDIGALDQGLQDFSKIINPFFKVDAQSIEGAGAAGGMGIATKVFLNGNLEPGIKLIKKLANFDERIVGADWVISGEGKLDIQTLSGKTIDGILTSLKKSNGKLAVFCGMIELEKQALEDIGISYAASVMDTAVDLEDALQNSKDYLKNIATTFAQKILR